MTYLSLFSGVGGFDGGLDMAGLKCIGQVESDRQASTVLAKHWPTVPRHDDVRTFNGPVRPDLICGGFPCQDLSVAGRRAGLAGERSGLWGEFRRIIADITPTWVLIENVPGLLSSWSGDTPDSLGIKPGRGRTMDLVETGDFSVVTSGLAELGYGWAMRVLDAQWFRLAQQRRRVFIVGCAGADVRRAAEVLFERESLPWDSPPSRQAGSRAATCLTSGVAASRGVNKPWRRREDDIAHALTSEGHDASEDGTGRGTPIVPVHASGCGNSNNLGVGRPGGPMHALDSTGDAAVAFQERGREGGRNLEWRDDDKAYSLNNPGKGGRTQESCIARGGVRRLTPKECCRLQGFPDDWLDGLGLSDSAKYRMLGNAVAVPVSNWIGRQLLRCVSADPNSERMT